MNHEFLNDNYNLMGVDDAPPCAEPRQNSNYATHTAAEMNIGQSILYMEDDCQTVSNTKKEKVFGWPVETKVFISYLIPIIGPLTMIILETEDFFSQFHAWQALMAMSPIFALFLIFVIVKTNVMIIITAIVYILVALGLALKACKHIEQDDLFKLPFIGQTCANMSISRLASSHIVQS